jgi:hypothetical protein
MGERRQSVLHNTRGRARLERATRSGNSYSRGGIGTKGNGTEEWQGSGRSAEGALIVNKKREAILHPCVVGVREYERIPFDQRIHLILIASLSFLMRREKPTCASVVTQMMLARALWQPDEPHLSATYMRAVRYHVSSPLSHRSSLHAINCLVKTDKQKRMILNCSSTKMQNFECSSCMAVRGKLRRTRGKKATRHNQTPRVQKR